MDSEKIGEMVEIGVLVIVPMVAVAATAVYLLGGPWLTIAAELGGMLVVGWAFVAIEECRRR